ncbi:MAG: SRPBCC family protein [Devosia sp.]
MSIVIKTSIDINAPTKDVWAVLTDFPAYGEWSNFSKIDGVAQTGTKLAMKMPGMSFGSTVTAAAPEQKLEWAAKIFSKNIFEGRHTFTLTANPDGSTHLDNIETFSGGLIWPFQSLFKQGEGGRANGYDGFNQALKERVEQRSAAS